MDHPSIPETGSDVTSETHEFLARCRTVEKNLVEAERLRPGHAGRVGYGEDLPGPLGFGLDPAPDGRMIGRLLRREQEPEEVLDLPQAQAHGEGGGGQLPELAPVDEDSVFGLAPVLGDSLPEPVILGAKFGARFARFGTKPLLHLAGVLLDRLAAASGLLGLSRHSALMTREDGSSVEDPGANR